MPRVDLAVSFQEKDQAKSLGAKWDAAAKIWYVPEGIDPAPFQQWAPTEHSSPNVRCSHFYIAEAQQECWKCAASVRMVAFALPSGWEEWGYNEEDEPSHWMVQDFGVLLDRVGLLNDAAIEAVQALNPQYKMVIRPAFYAKRYMNHCEKCGVHQKEPNSGDIHVFKPDTVTQAKALMMHYYNKPFEGHCLYQDDLIGMEDIIFKKQA